MTRIPPLLLALLLILGAAAASAVAVSALATTPRSSAFTLPTVRPAGQATAAPNGVVRGPLDGEPTQRSKAERQPIAALLDNEVDARPQVGIGRASVVFEAPTEAGITRLLAIFQERDASSLGPVRSARPYFIDWAAPFHPLFVHDGGSPAAQSSLERTHVVTNVDSAKSGTTFHRLSDRQSPHDLFSATYAIRTLARVKSLLPSGNSLTLPHKQMAPVGKRGRGRPVTLEFSLPGLVGSSYYTVGYRYDPASDMYVRSVGGNPSIDGLTNRQIQAANVIVMYTVMSPIVNDLLGRISIRTTGTGQALYLMDGQEIKGTWAKPSPSAPIRFQDSAGRELRLNPGQTWIEVVSPGALHHG